MSFQTVIKWMLFAASAISITHARASNCRTFDCSLYSDWKGGCEASSCGTYKCEWLDNRCTFAEPRPPSPDGIDCPKQGYAYCTNVAVIYQKRTAGQALDMALARNDAMAKASCSKGFYSTRTGKIDVNIISVPNGASDGPIDEVEVRQNYLCGPW